MALFWRSSRHPNAAGTPGRQPRWGQSRRLLPARIDRIMSLIAAGYLRDAREACADLVFDSQPLIVAEGLSRMQRLATALRRCDGHQLLRRLAIAADGRRCVRNSCVAYHRGSIYPDRASAGRGLPRSSATICMRARKRCLTAWASGGLIAWNSTSMPGRCCANPSDIGFDDDSDLRVATDSWGIAHQHNRHAAAGHLNGTWDDTVRDDVVALFVGPALAHPAGRPCDPSDASCGRLPPGSGH